MCVVVWGGGGGRGFGEVQDLGHLVAEKLLHCVTSYDVASPSAVVSTTCSVFM